MNKQESLQPTRCPLMHPNPSNLGCDWCGKALPKRCRRWCSTACTWAWLNNHMWTHARAEALRRVEVRDVDGWFVGHRCAHCAGVFRAAEYRGGQSVHAVEVNHRVPVLGKHSQTGCWHHQDGLEVLCRGCHRDVTRRQRENGWRPVTARIVLEQTLF